MVPGTQQVWADRAELKVCGDWGQGAGFGEQDLPPAGPSWPQGGCTSLPLLTLQGSRLSSGLVGCRWEQFVIPFSKELRFPWRPSPHTHPGSIGHVHTCVCLLGVGWVGGRVGLGWRACSVLFMPEWGREGCQHQLPAPHNDANLAPATLFCFCHILGRFSHPPPSLQFLRLPVCHLFINFVLREQMAGAELGRMHLLPLPYNSLLEHTAHRLQTNRFLAFSNQKIDFLDRPHIPGPCLTPDPAQMKLVPRSLLV